MGDKNKLQYGEAVIAKFKVLSPTSAASNTHTKPVWKAGTYPSHATGINAQVNLSTKIGVNDLCHNNKNGQT
jgi:hypothetical protein